MQSILLLYSSFCALGCHRCGEEGHKSDNCFRRRESKCLQCMEYGHSTDRCPIKQALNGKNRFNPPQHPPYFPPQQPPQNHVKPKCSMCGGVGHTEDRCGNNLPSESFSTLNINGAANRNRMASHNHEDNWELTNEDHERILKDMNPEVYKDQSRNSYTRSNNNKDASYLPRGSPVNVSRESPVRNNFARSKPNMNENNAENEAGGQSDHITKREVYIPPEPKKIDDHIQEDRKGVNFFKYKDMKTSMTGKNIPIKLISFDEAVIDDNIRQNMTRLTYQDPTPIQMCSLPAISTGRDVMACATTGSGKTAAFLIPVMTAMLEQGLHSQPGEPITLIISPTKELARQIYDDVRNLGHHTAIIPALVYGGVSIVHQLRLMSSGSHIIIATPGRLKQFLRERKVKLHMLRHFILDEADTMLHMNFMEDIKEIVFNFDMPENVKRQTLMFSATFRCEIQKLAQEFLKSSYIHITIGLLGSASSDIEQQVFCLQIREKRKKLMEILNSIGDDKVLIFVSTKRYADFLGSFLSQNNFRATTIHGDRLQSQREEALADFVSSNCNVLIATDVLSRGHDIQNLKHVIVHDLPEEMDTYVHRIGRTGRLGNIGYSYTFFTPDKDMDKARSLVKIMSEANQKVPNWLETMSNGALGSGFGGNSSMMNDTRNNKFNDKEQSSFIDQADDEDENWD